ncbi:MAG: UDP-N-acetylmuramoyl-tripeptide--D-alanyl-D-alanine ligase [Alphaproteobacteria bacterium]|nr:UDP-N-acetylmuramoyl-tripeptide--D-alanyl-D-alanine ligase [Alphaproteobacteria bacterium]
MIHIVLNILTFLAFVAFAAKRLLTYLHALQQDDYDPARFGTWAVKNAVLDKRLSMALAATALAGLILPGFLTGLIVFLCFAVVAYKERDPRTHSKKKLVLTARAKRIFGLGLALSLCGAALTLSYPAPWVWIVNVQAVPLSLIAAVLLLRPQEYFVQKKYLHEARTKIDTLRPTIIGITGSFGKTSVKHILGHILKTQASTLMTPGSVNTPMGITRIIREDLNDAHTYFIVEMGAYGPGSIKRLCDLTPPDVGIITAIGHAHYERFKSLETVARAKFELAEAVGERHGKMIVHEQTLEFFDPASMPGTVFLTCGEKEGSDFSIRRIEQTKKGLDVEIAWGGKAEAFSVPLYGLHHGVNAALAFAAAVTLGVEPESIRTALKSIPQIRHRLEVTRQADGTTIIDDAFNSNPAGFRSALELLSALKEDGGRTILITPGMVELGRAHDQAHAEAGALAALHCDIVLAVNPDRIRSFVTAFKSIGGDKILFEKDSFAQASVWLGRNARAGDVILIENDLPDLYERIARI